jgi:hypothetical protein
MKAIVEKFNDVSVYVEVYDDENIEVLSIAEESANKDGFHKLTTDFSSRKIESVKKVIKDMASSFGSDIRTIADEMMPDEFEVELSLTCSGGLWTIIKGEGQVKVKFIWKNNKIS